MSFELYGNPQIRTWTYPGMWSDDLTRHFYGLKTSNFVYSIIRFITDLFKGFHGIYYRYKDAI